MRIPKLSFEESLGRFVLPDRCTGCASCIIVCPFKCIEYVDGKPSVTGECKSCGICIQVCPKYGFSTSDLETIVFRRERREDEKFGIYRRILLARTRDEEIRQVCQDGGVVTTLLKLALEKGTIDGAAVSGISEEEPLKPVPKLVTKVKEILECAGTRYSYSPNIFALSEGVKKKKRRIAFVGTPCQINAVRKIQAIPLKKYAGALYVTIGLFCSESFKYESLVKDLIQERLGLDPRDVKKVNIKGKLIVTSRTGETRTIRLKEAKKYLSTCALCSDFSSELADISVGGLGQERWTLTIIRTKRGEELFQEAETRELFDVKPVEDEAAILDLLSRFSERKRRLYLQNERRRIS